MKEKKQIITIAIIAMILLSIVACLITYFVFGNGTSSDEDVYDYSPSGIQIARNQLIIETDGSVDEAYVSSFAEKNKAKVVGRVGSTDYFLIEFNKDTKVSDMEKKIKKFKQEKFITLCNYNYIWYEDPETDYCE